MATWAEISQRHGAALTADAKRRAEQTPTDGQCRWCHLEPAHAPEPYDDLCMSCAREAHDDRH